MGIFPKPLEIFYSEAIFSFSQSKSYLEKVLDFLGYVASGIGSM